MNKPKTLAIDKLQMTMHYQYSISHAATNCQSLIANLWKFDNGQSLMVTERSF